MLLRFDILFWSLSSVLSRARRTMVYDDQSDYFTTGNNPWLTTEQRDALRKREAEIRAAQNVPRSQRKITLDIAGRQVIEVS